MNQEQPNLEKLASPENPSENAAEQSLETRLLDQENHLDASVKETFQEIAQIESGVAAQDIAETRQEIVFTDKMIENQRKAYDLLAAARLAAFRNPLPKRELVKPVPVPDPVFMPEEELDKIKKASKDERPELLKAFKEQLVLQQEGIAFLQHRIIDTIRKNPDVDTSELYAEIAQDETLKLAPDQKQVVSELLSLYEEKHIAVRSIREQYPDDTELYRELFGVRPKGGIEIIEGPITLYFRCENRDDYARIFTQSFLVGAEARKEDTEMTDRSGGVSIGTSPIIGLEGTITAENTSRIKKNGLHGEKLIAYQETVRVHEEQHAIRRMFEKQLGDRPQWIRLRDSEPGEARERALTAYLRAHRGMIADERAADEILAYSTERNLASTFATLTKRKEEGGLYDYLAEEKKKTENELVRMFGKQIQPLVEQEIKRIYEDEYHNLLRDTISMVKHFQSKGYATDEVIALFIREPLSRWRTIARRIYLERKSRLNTKSEPETKE